MSVQNLRHGNKQVRLDNVNLLDYWLYRGFEAVESTGALYDEDPEQARRFLLNSSVAYRHETRCGESCEDVG